jgi:CBS domain-containing protein
MATASDVIKQFDRRMPIVCPDESVLVAAKLMNDFKVGALLVCENEHCMGMFTEHDLLRRVIAAQRDPAETPVREVMSDKVIVCQPETSIDEARRVMAIAHCHNLPVVDANGDVLGLLTLTDLNSIEYASQELEIDSLKKYLYSGR